MKSHKELIEITKHIRISGEMQSYFKFGAKYLINLKRKNTINNKEFFNMIRLCKDSYKNLTLKNALGKQGKNYEYRDWCTLILNNKELTNLSIEELLYVMEYGSRLADIKNKSTINM